MATPPNSPSATPEPVRGSKPVAAPSLAMPTSCVSTAALHFPEAQSLFTFRLRPLKEIKQDCLVVLDTNVLLVPYTINPKGLDEVGAAYKKLVDEKRLKIPAQVAQEFANSRAMKLTDLHKALANRRSKDFGFSQGKYPLLEGVAAYQEAVKLEKELEDLARKYKAAVDLVVKHVEGWLWDDPVSLLYSSLFDETVICEPMIAEDDLKRDLSRRLAHKIPPGYKDAGKEDEGVGDILIWHTILELGRTTRKDVIFVSTEDKPDWFNQSDKKGLYPRFELVDEYRRAASGAAFHILKLSEFLDLFGVEKAVVKEVREEEIKIQESAPELSGSASSAKAFVAEEAVKRWISGFADWRVTSVPSEFYDFEVFGRKFARSYGVEVINGRSGKLLHQKLTFVYRRCAEGDRAIVVIVVQGIAFVASAVALAGRFDDRLECIIGRITAEGDFMPDHFGGTLFA